MTAIRMTAIWMTAVWMSAVLVSANPQLGNHTLGGDRQRALDGATAGAFVAASAERLGHRCNVYCALAAQAYAEASIGLLAEEQGDFDAPNSQGVVDQSLAVFLLRFTALHGLVGYVHPGQAAITMKRAKGRAQQPHLRELRREVHVVCDLHGIGAGAHQFLRQRESSLGGAGETESASVSENCGVKAGRNFGRNLDAGFARQPEDHLRSGTGVGINPVHVGKRARRGVMVDVDEVVALQSGQAGAGHAIALENDRGFRFRGLFNGMQYGVGVGQWPINAGNAIAEHDIRLLAHAAENLAAGQRRSDGVTIGPRMRGEDKLLSSPYLIEDFFEHPLGPGSTVAFSFFNTLE